MADLIFNRKSPWYNSYDSMMSRCYNPNAANYDNYGGRGIVVCDEWRHNPSAFGEWATSNGYKEGLTIERKDVNGNYCPENCCWVTRKAQANNRRSNTRLSLNGETHTISEWSEIAGISKITISSRLRLGWSVERALTEPSLGRGFNQYSRKKELAKWI